MLKNKGARNAMEKIKINTVPSYTVELGHGLTEKAGELIKSYTSSDRIMIVSDENVFGLHGKKLLAALRAAGYKCGSFVIKPGETSKTSSTLFALWEALASNGFTRNDTVLSFGGGVVSDLGGFAAATYMRGIKHIIFSTSLLSMADASVGGKTAIDLKAGKNLAGTFYAPQAVFCDISLLSTLPPTVYGDGMAEIIKCGMIRSESLLFTVFGNPSAEKIIAEAIKIKKEYVELDEKDTGERHMLNFGHTLAHAAETLSSGRLSHGRAVAAGMYTMTEAAIKNGLCTPVTLDILGNILDKYKLPRTFPFTLRELCAAALNDKKRIGDRVNVILPTGIGKAIIKELPSEALYDFLSK